MKDTVTKFRALLSMKSCLIEVLRSDLASAAAKIDVLTDANQALCKQNNWLIGQRDNMNQKIVDMGHEIVDLHVALETMRDEQRILLRDNQELIKQMEEWWSQQDDDKDWINVQVNMDKETDHA